MRKIRVTVSTGVTGSKRERVIHVEDDATNEEIQEAAEEIKNEMIEWYYEEIE